MNTDRNASRLVELYARPVQVFDLDGTLVDTLVDLTVSLNMALYDHGLPPVSRDLVRESLHGGFEASVNAALMAASAPPDRFEPLLASYRRRYRAISGKLARTYCGVPQVLTGLRRRGARLAVCSNKAEGEARSLLAFMGLGTFFEAVVGADTCGARKPHPAPLLRAIEMVGGEPGLAVFTGDSDVDLECAQAAGVDCVFFGGGYGSTKRLPGATLADWNDLNLAD